MLDQSKEIKVCTYLGLTTLILSVTLVGCGGGSSSGGSSNTPKPSEPTPEVMTDITQNPCRNAQCSTQGI